MSYILSNGSRPLIFVANVRTGSTATANAVMKMGAERDGEHHSPPSYIPRNAIVFQTVRNHYEVLTSLWWKGKPYGCFEHFVFAACRGEYEHVSVPMYNRLGITHNLRYRHLDGDLKKVFALAGLPPPPKLKRTPTKTPWGADNMFSHYLRQPVQAAFGEEIERLEL